VELFWWRAAAFFRIADCLLFIADVPSFVVEKVLTGLMMLAPEKKRFHIREKNL